MSKVLVLIVLTLSCASVAKAQEVYPILPKQHFSCRYYTGDTLQTVIVKDIDAADLGSATRLARASELEEAPYSNPIRWVLLSDLNNPNPSEAFKQGIYVLCKPTSVVSPLVVGRQSTGRPYALMSKSKFSCTFKSQDGSRLIYNKEFEAMNEFYAIRVARVNELIFDDHTLGRPARWVLSSDMDNPRPTSSYTRGVNVSCLPLN